MAEIISIHLNKEFKRIYYRSKSYVSPALVVYFTKNRAGFCRLGITASKKIGSAVKRNRAKRVIREAYRACLPQIDGHYDFVIVARHQCTKIKSQEAAKMLAGILKKAGLLKVEQ